MEGAQLSTGKLVFLLSPAPHAWHPEGWKGAKSCFSLLVGAYFSDAAASWGAAPAWGCYVWGQFCAIHCWGLNFPLRGRTCNFTGLSRAPRTHAGVPNARVPTGLPLSAQEVLENLKDRWYQADNPPPDLLLTEEEFLSFLHPEHSRGMLRFMVKEIVRDLGEAWPPCQQLAGPPGRGSV